MRACWLLYCRCMYACMHACMHACARIPSCRCFPERIAKGCSSRRPSTNLRRAAFTGKLAQSNLRKETCAEQLAHSNLHRPTGKTCTEQLLITDRLALSNLHCSEQSAQRGLRGAGHVLAFARSQVGGGLPQNIWRQCFRAPSCSVHLLAVPRHVCERQLGLSQALRKLLLYSVAAAFWHMFAHAINHHENMSHHTTVGFMTS